MEKGNLLLNAFCSSIVGGMLAVCTSAIALPFDPIALERGCFEESCMICVPDNNVPWGQGETLGDFISQVPELRCVEYDGIPPSHCAYVVKKIWQILENGHYEGNDVWLINCRAGTATSTICSNAWVSPPIGD